MRINDWFAKFADPKIFDEIRSYLKQFFGQKKDSGKLFCLVELDPGRNGTGCGAFLVKVSGSIHSAKQKQNTFVNLVITDVTDGVEKANPAHSAISEYRLKNSSVFCYNTELGRLPRAVTVLADWTLIAEINTDWILLPRKGIRNLLFIASIISADDHQEIASTYCSTVYENKHQGYLDLQENKHQADALVVTIAFAVAAADDDLNDSEVALIREWAIDNIAQKTQPGKKDTHLENAFRRTIRLIKAGRKIDLEGACNELAAISDFASRQRTIQVCMNVAKAKGYVNHNELLILNKIAGSLEIEKNYFLTLAEKIIPVDICQTDDIGLILGITDDMSPDQVRVQLNDQYRKWSARVTNFDPQVRHQAESMLKLIADARTQLVK